MTTKTIEVKENLAVSPTRTITKGVVSVGKDETLVNIAAVEYGDRSAFRAQNTTYPIEQYRVLVNQDDAQKIVGMLISELKYESQYLTRTGTYILTSESQVRAAYVDGVEDSFYWVANEDGLWDILEWVDIDDIIFLTI